MKAIRIEWLWGAFEQAICFHLILICEAFKREIASDFNLKSPINLSFKELCDQLESRDIICQHSVMLADLELDSKSWLSELIAMYNLYIGQSLDSGEYQPSPIAAGIVVEQGSKLSVIKLKDITCLSVEEKYQAFHRELKDIIIQYRASMEQW